MDDIDQNAHNLATFVTRFTSHYAALGDKNHLILQPYDLHTLRLVPQNNISDSPKLDLVAVYDQLVNHWLIDLPLDVPGRARITKERAIRFLVADIVLSQIIWVLHEPTISGADPDKNAPQSNHFTGGPLKTDGHCTPGTLASYADQRFQPEAPTVAAQSSSAIGGSFSESQADKWPTYTALSSYTDFERAGSTSRDAERILDHWKPGTDPALYSLMPGESQIAAKGKASRRKSRRNVSQSMKNIGFDSSIPLPATSPAPVRGDWGSQPDNSQHPMMRLQSSQVVHDLPMTQVERGAFGGREASKSAGIKARKKKRAAGF